LFQNGFIHEIWEYATFLLLQFIPKLFSLCILSIINVLAPTVCFKITFSTRSGRIPLFCPYSLYQRYLVEVFRVKKTFWLVQFVSKSLRSRSQGVCHFSAPQVCTKLVQSRYFEYNKHFGSYNLFQNHFIHEIREYATFMLLHFVPNSFRRGILSVINVSAPTVCFKVDSFTRSGSMPLFCSYILYKLIHSRDQEVCYFFAPSLSDKLVQSRDFEYNKRFGSYSLFQNGFIHEIWECATFLLLQFIPKLFSRSILSIINVLAPTVCFKITFSTRSGRIPLFFPYSLYQSYLVEVFRVK